MGTDTRICIEQYKNNKELAVIWDERYKTKVWTRNGANNSNTKSNGKNNGLCMYTTLWKASNNVLQYKASNTIPAPLHIST